MNDPEEAPLSAVVSLVACMSMQCYIFILYLWYVLAACLEVVTILDILALGIYAASPEKDC